METDLHGIRCIRVDNGLEGQARLLVLLREAAWVVAIARPNCLLPVDQRFEAGAPLVQPVRRDDVSQDHVAVFEELIGINLQRISSTTRTVMRSDGPFQKLRDVLRAARRPDNSSASGCHSVALDSAACSVIDGFGSHERRA